MYFHKEKSVFLYTKIKKNYKIKTQVYKLQIFNYLKIIIISYNFDKSLSFDPILLFNNIITSFDLIHKCNFILITENLLFFFFENFC